ncbi:MAG TPA: invasion associated locus B family protein [Rhizomicrobium sp.]|nr:invasion associated locus B family protein [Rhizomicrobium sp.]
MKLALTGIAAGTLLATGAALAQAPSEQADLVKSVGDWQVRCFKVQNQNPCDQYWEQVDQRTGQRAVTVSIAYSPSMERHLVVITVPLGVSLPKGLTVQTDNYSSPPMHYRTCSRDGCFVQLVDNALVEALAKSGADGKLNIVGDDGKSYSLPLSLKGFAGAHDEMVSDAKTRAKPVPAPAKP